MFDTNVFISALIFCGSPRLLLRMAEEGVFRLQLSQAILDETAWILNARFYWPPEEVGEVRELLSSIADSIVPRMALKICRDPDDDRVIECSQASHSDYIATGGKDLLVLRQYAGAQIVKRGEFLAIAQGCRQ